MNLFALISIAFAMSTDAFAAAIGKGAAIRHPSILHALKIGLLFGTIEAMTPLLGWLIGWSTSAYVQQWNHWVTLILLSIIGLHMIRASFGSEDEAEEQSAAKNTSGPSFILMALTAFGTSIDAMAVGVSLAFVDVNIVLAAALIGLATCLMVTIGIMLGSKLGILVGKRAEALGGVVLIGVGIWLFVSH